MAIEVQPRDLHAGLLISNLNPALFLHQEFSFSPGKTKRYKIELNILKVRYNEERIIKHCSRNLIPLKWV